MSERPTPETDAFFRTFADGEATPSHAEYYDRMTKLERERDAERALADRLADCLNNLWHHHSLTEESYDYIDNVLDAWKEARGE